MTRPQILGILNVTPDSFSDGGLFFDPDLAFARGLRLLEEGADIIDVGGESTRPGSRPLPPEEEQKRVLPVIAQLRAAGAVISIDTRNASTMQAALDAGATMVNDISALTHDPDSMGVVARRDCRVVLMHMQGTPETMQDNPVYADVVREVREWLALRVNACLAAGIAAERLIVDPGIGFGKTSAHNVALLAHVDALAPAGISLMIGASRKRFISAIAPLPDASDRLGGSIAVVLKAAEMKAAYLRVHDVGATRQALHIWRACGKAAPLIQ